MIRKYHNHKLQTNPWNREEEPHNNHETQGRQIKQSNQLSLPHQDDCKTRISNLLLAGYTIETATTDFLHIHFHLYRSTDNLENLN